MSCYTTTSSEHSPHWIPVALSVELPPELQGTALEIIEKAKVLFPKELLPRDLQRTIGASSVEHQRIHELFFSFQTHAFPSFLQIEGSYKKQHVELEGLSTDESSSLLAELTVFAPLLTEAGGAIGQINLSFMKQLRLHPEVVTHLDLSSVSGQLSDEKLSGLLGQFPQVLHLVLDRAIHLSRDSFSGILRCNNLVILSLRACSGLLKWDATPRGSLSQLQVLNLTYLSDIKSPVCEWVKGLNNLRSLDLSYSSPNGIDLTGLRKRGVLLKGLD